MNTKTIIRALIAEIRCRFCFHKKQRTAVRYAFGAAFHDSIFSNAPRSPADFSKRFISYEYASMVHRKHTDDGNLGDNIQTLSVQSALTQIAADKQPEFVRCARDGLVKYLGAKATCIMQGWYEHSSLNFLPSRNVLPVWVGTHFCKSTRETLRCLIKCRPSIFSNTEIGCRDISTLNFCRTLGIKAYFSRCLTLTFPRRKSEPKNKKVFLVNLPEWASQLIPPPIEGR